LKQREASVAEQQRALARAADASSQQQQQLAREQEALAAAAKQIEADRAAAADKAQELERQRRSNEAARRCAGIAARVGKLIVFCEY
jgi:chromosome segregation ATPase